MIPRSAQRGVLLLISLLLAFGAAGTLILDSLDGDDVGPPAGVLPVLPVRLRCSLPLPSETARIQARERGARAPRPLVPAPTSLRAPPTR